MNRHRGGTLHLHHYHVRRDIVDRRDFAAPRSGWSLTRETPPHTVALTRTSLGGVMGSIVEFTCRSCGFTTEHLRVGWGKEGRTRFLAGSASARRASGYRSSIS